MKTSGFSVRLASETSETSGLSGQFAPLQASETSGLPLGNRTDGRCKPDVFKNGRWEAM